MKAFQAVGVALSLATLPLLGCQGLTVSPKNQQVIMTQKQKFDTIQSAYAFDETLARLKSGIESRGMTIFAVINHQAAAAQAGMRMQPATVVIFGNPKAGTHLMQKDPNFALSLPLKVLVTQQGEQVQVIMQTPDSLIEGSTISPDDIKNSLAKANMLIASLVK